MHTWKTMIRTALIFCVAALATSVLRAQAPVIFFTDITSGPATGGENGGGAYVTVYGNYFGTTPGTVSVGGVNATTVTLWGSPSRWYQKLTFQVPTNVAQGSAPIQVKTAAGSSNTSPFTVRAGNIYCVSTTGNDKNNGHFPSSCFASLPQAKNTMVAGDITYAENGVSQTSIDNYSASLSIASGGTAAAPIALIAYPGATVTIGSNTVQYGVRTPAISGTKDYWVLSGLTLRGLDALDLVTNTGWRVIANDMSCPNGSGESACFHTDTNTYVYFFGNYVHDVGDQAGSIDKYFHAVYYTTNTNHVWMGWNEVAPNPNHSQTSGGCRAVQFYSTGGSDQYDLHVYSNLIHDAICDGINFATVNPTLGTVEAYNNIVYHVGTGPDPADGSSNYSCLLAGTSGSPSVAVMAYNNTFYDCGARKTSDAGAFAPDTPVQANNNIIYQLSGESYTNSSSSSSALTGSNNIWYGSSSAVPSSATGNITSNPLLTNVAGTSFTLQSGSPAIGHGVNNGLTQDFSGVARNTSAEDIGALAYGVATASASPCDLNGDGVVNSLDVASAANQALGIAACTNAALRQSGACTIIDVQRVINASKGLACKVGP